MVERRVHSPPFSRRGGCAINKKIPFLSGPDGVVRKFKQNKEATRPFTNHLVCAAKERGLLFMGAATPP